LTDSPIVQTFEASVTTFPLNMSSRRRRRLLFLSMMVDGFARFGEVIDGWPWSTIFTPAMARAPAGECSGVGRESCSRKAMAYPDREFPLLDKLLRARIAAPQGWGSFS
jgi:hypothetical protein